jgi:hypothetical protein
MRKLKKRKKNRLREEGDIPESSEAEDRKDHFQRKVVFV